MIKRVFICLDKQFPRKNASANYVEYLGRTIQNENIEIYILSISGTKGECDQWIEYHDMQYCNVLYDVSNPLNTLRSRVEVGFAMWNKMEQKNIDSEDVIICYSENFFLLKTIYNRSKLKEIEVVNCVTEWHIAKQYKYGNFDIFNYWYYCLGFYKGLKCCKNIITVSEKLKNYFQKKGCATFLLPPLTDPYEFKYDETKDDDKIKFIYSGQFDKKESMSVMLSALASVKDRGKNSLEFHLTGCNRLKFTEILNVLQEEERKKVADRIILHEWLSYKDLIKLYNQMHFLLIARPENRATLSNFPSKVPEMMSYGIIPIMNRVGDCPDYYLKDGKDSILFSSCNVEKCSAAIARALDLPAEQRREMQRCARDKAEKVFYYEKWHEPINKFLFNDEV